MAQVEPLSILQQADLIDTLVSHCVMHGGETAGETTILIDKQTAEQLHHLALRLHRLAPYEGRIKAMVMAK